MSPRCSPSWGWNAVPRPPPTPSASSTTSTTPLAARGTRAPTTRDLVPCSQTAAVRHPRDMYSDGSALEQLSQDECLLLMASVSVGRIVYTRRALPAVELVNFALDHGDIIIRTDSDGKLAVATQ